MFARPWSSDNHKEISHGMLHFSWILQFLFITKSYIPVIFMPCFRINFRHTFFSGICCPVCCNIKQFYSSHSATTLSVLYCCITDPEWVWPPISKAEKIPHSGYQKSRVWSHSIHCGKIAVSGLQGSDASNFIKPLTISCTKNPHKTWCMNLKPPISHCKSSLLCCVAIL